MDFNRKEKMKLKDLTNKQILAITFGLLFLITVSTQFYGHADIGDYIGVSKFFAGEYDAKIRSSHSYFYGFMLSPFEKITDSFLGIKLISLMWLILLILSIYYISNKDRKTLLLTVTAPIFWYMAPVIGPIQIASLFFLWGYYFLKRYDLKAKITNLFYAGIFFGIAWVFWDTVLHLGVLLTFCFFWKKKFSHLIYFLFFILIGLIPRLILDQVLFNFPFFTIMKSFSGGIVNSLWAGSLGSGHASKSFVNIFSVLIVLPFFSHLLLKSQNFKNDKKTILFLILSFLLILSNPQIRYLLILSPIILLKLGKIINKKQLKKYIIFSIFVSILVSTPYLIQIKYSTNSPEFNSLLDNLLNIEISEKNPEKIIIQDLKNIAEDFPNQRFLVGNHPDESAFLARLYWGDGIQEFISRQDYDLYFNNQSVLFEKEFRPISNIKNRREIWIKGGISRKITEFDNYENISLAIRINAPIDLQGFKLLKKYDLLYVSKKL